MGQIVKPSCPSEIFADIQPLKPLPKGVEVFVESRGSRIEGIMSRVEGKMSRVEGKCRGFKNVGIFLLFKKKRNKQSHKNSSCRQTRL